jgi:hypothetical protein
VTSKKKAVVRIRTDDLFLYEVARMVLTTIDGKHNHVQQTNTIVDKCIRARWGGLLGIWMAFKSIVKATCIKQHIPFKGNRQRVNEKRNGVWGGGWEAANQQQEHDAIPDSLAMRTMIPWLTRLN